MNLPDAPIAREGFFVTHFFTVSDQEKSKDFYVRILGGKVIKPENPCYIKLANSWIILNSGGGPTPDKPEVLLETPSDLNRVNSFLNLRVADIWACYKEWRDKGAVFLTEPLDNHGWEWRCYMRDPDGYLIEVGQYTQIGARPLQKLCQLNCQAASPIRKPMVPLSPNATNRWVGRRFSGSLLTLLLNLPGAPHVGLTCGAFDFDLFVLFCQLIY